MPGMTRRNYSQFCGLAHALDVVGERWTLLIVRELNTGPKRYGELAEALPGIGTSLLATRVRQLEGDGVVQRRLVLDQPSSAVVYELTDAGRELAAAVAPLALWGARHKMDLEKADDEVFRAEWALGFLAGGGGDGLPDGAAATYEFRIDDSVACLEVRDGRMTVTPGASATPCDVTVRAASSVIAAIAAQRTTVRDEVAAGRMVATGDPDAILLLNGIVDRRLASLGCA